MATTRKLSNLELTVLGLAWLRGPCTIYSIMKELSMSASSFHKSRAGTAYSVANRLIGFKLLETKAGNAATPEGSVQITDSGIKALKSWFDLPTPATDVAHSADLLRLRFFFIGIVEEDQRLAFIDSSIQELQVLLDRCKDLVGENQRIGDYFGALATLSVVLETEARITWLRTVREWVENPLSPEVDWANIILESPANKSIGQLK
jgi:DNA-binding PadR family transcriptional regulator